MNAKSPPARRRCIDDKRRIRFCACLRSGQFRRPECAQFRRQGPVRIAIQKSDRQQYAGVRAGLDRTGVNVRASYDRGYRDGSYVRAQEPRAYQAYPYAAYSNGVDPRTGGSSYAGNDLYGPRGTYGYRPYARYEAGLDPITALLGIASMPFAAVTSSSRSGQGNFANWVAYCSARYGSFDPASGTFLADDGNRYYCS